VRITSASNNATRAPTAITVYRLRPIVTYDQHASRRARPMSGDVSADSDRESTEPAEPDAAVADSPVDAVAPWLLRVGIDDSGVLDLVRLWDIGVRGAVLADLWLTGRISDAGESLEIDTQPTGVRYLDAAIGELVGAGAGATELQWLAHGRLRAADVAGELVASGEWTRRWSFTASRWRVYRSREMQQYIPLRKRLAHTYDGDTAPVSAAEATVALLGYTLNVVRPKRTGNVVRPKRTGGIAPRATSPLGPGACGPAASVVGATIDAIVSWSALGYVDSNPNWGPSGS